MSWPRLRLASTRETTHGAGLGTSRHPRSATSLPPLPPPPPAPNLEHLARSGSATALGHALAALHRTPLPEGSAPAGAPPWATPGPPEDLVGRAGRDWHHAAWDLGELLATAYAQWENVTTIHGALGPGTVRFVGADGAVEARLAPVGGGQWPSGHPGWDLAAACGLLGDADRHRGRQVRARALLAEAYAAGGGRIEHFGPHWCSVYALHRAAIALVAGEQEAAALWTDRARHPFAWSPPGGLTSG